MRRLAALVLGGAVVLGGVALADPDRWIRENHVADGGQFTTATLPLNMGGPSPNGKTTLVNAPCSSNTCTRSAPAASNEGLEMGAVSAWMCTVCVDAGTFVDGGVVEVWRGTPIPSSTALDWAEIPELQWTTKNNSVCSNSGAMTNSFRANGSRAICRVNGIKTSGAAPTLESTAEACLRAGQGCGPP